MTGWFEYSILLGASTVLTIILKKLKCKYYDNGITVEMIVEITRRASQEHIRRFLPCK
jgi:hypothetical protein